MRESTIQKGIIDYLKTKGILHWRANVGRFRTDTGRYIRTGIPGLADIMSVHDGTCYALEVKTPTGRQSQNQKKFQAEFEAAGGIYKIVRSIQDVKEVFEDD